MSMQSSIQTGQQHVLWILLYSFGHLFIWPLSMCVVVCAKWSTQEQCVLWMWKVSALRGAEQWAVCVLPSGKAAAGLHGGFPPLQRLSLIHISSLSLPPLTVYTSSSLKHYSMLKAFSGSNRRLSVLWVRKVSQKGAWSVSDPGKFWDSENLSSKVENWTGNWIGFESSFCTQNLFGESYNKNYWFHSNAEALLYKRTSSGGQYYKEMLFLS